MKRVLPLWLAALVGLAAADTAQAQVLYGLTGAGTLVQFNSATPGTLSAPQTIGGLAAGDALVGIDVRPLDGLLFGLGYNTTAGTARIYTINPATGAATQPTPANVITMGTGVTGFGIDFNPVANAFRIVTNGVGGSASNNFRVPGGGTGTPPVTDTSLNPGTPDVRAAAYTNNVPGGFGNPTTLYDIDAANNLATQGGLNGTPSPNGGTLNTVATLTLGGTAFPGPVTGFDIAGSNGTAFLSTATGLFSLNLANGNTTSLGTFPAGTNMVGITAVPEPGTLALCGLAAAGLLGYRRKKRPVEQPAD